MISGDDIYKVVSSVFPLYVALLLGYGSVKWWNMFKPDHCDAINRLNCYFIIPLFTFDFTTQVNPFKMNFKYLAANVISTVMVLIGIYIWAKFTKQGNYPWSITSFSLATLNNSLVVGVPLMQAMFGPLGVNLVIQSSILQFTIWNMIVLTMYAFHNVNRLSPDVSELKDIEGNNQEAGVRTTTTTSILMLMKIVGIKLAKNPNSYSCILGLAWSLVSYRWDLKMPSIIEGSVLIMARAGSGIVMFCIGLSMALQPKIIDCGWTLTAVAMLLKFIVAPTSMAVGSLMVGLRGKVLCMAIIQAALPQGVTSFMFAKEYDLHTSVMSTAVIFGTIVSLPLLISYFIVLDFVT